MKTKLKDARIGDVILTERGHEVLIAVGAKPFSAVSMSVESNAGSLQYHQGIPVSVVNDKTEREDWQEKGRNIWRAFPPHKQTVFKRLSRGELTHIIQHG